MWIVRPAPGEAERLEPGIPVTLKTTETVRFGHLCLVADRDGTQALALAVVLGEPDHHVKGTAYKRDALITNLFSPPLPLREPLGQRTAVSAVDEDWQAIGSQVEPCEWDFVVSASRALKPDEFKGKKTLEEPAERLVVELLKERGFDQVGRQVPLPGSSDPKNRRLANLKADVIGCSSADGKRHFLVVEGKWRAVGGSQAAAQAHEYARRIKKSGPRANGKSVFDYRVEEVQADLVHALVVANVVPERSDTADLLKIRRMTYLEFAVFLARREDLQLPSV